MLPQSALTVLYWAIGAIVVALVAVRILKTVGRWPGARSATARRAPEKPARVVASPAPQQTEPKQSPFMHSIKQK